MVLPDSLISVASGSFYNCQTLKSFQLPSWFDTIPSYFIANSNYIESVTNFPTDPLYIGSSALQGVSRLVWEYVPSNATLQISINAFQNASRIYGDITNLSQNLTLLADGAFSAAGSLSTFGGIYGTPTINGAKLKRIGANAFRQTKITGITILDGVEEIGNSAFQSVTSLSTSNATILLPQSLTKMGTSVFAGTGAGLTINTSLVPQAVKDSWPAGWSGNATVI